MTYWGKHANFIIFGGGKTAGGKGDSDIKGGQKYLQQIKNYQKYSSSYDLTSGLIANQKKFRKALEGGSMQTHGIEHIEHIEEATTVPMMTTCDVSPGPIPGLDSSAKNPLQ